MDEASIFLEALQKPSSDERAAFLDRACAVDDELRRNVELLLRAHDKAGGFLADSPALAGVTVDRPFTESPGTVIGPYKLLEQIGEGGMGTVWMAQQTEPVKRLVALKLIKAGMDSKAVIARFEAERQALALMDHPNIAKVLDAGTTGQAGRRQSADGSEKTPQLPTAECLLPNGGRPYFVMDLVKGVPITKYCDEHHLTPRQRLELFIPVCQAVQHAHQKGIIHRDLKPSNVLVALYDGKPVPKVIDFGVAKAAGQSLTEKTLVTGFGAIIGTLEYMSPEQTEFNQLDIDTRSDIYSLGVLMYELMSDTTPLERKRAKESSILEALRVIREEDAPTLSNRLATTENLPTVAANRGLEPVKLTKLMRGELDWIVTKALEKDRGRRYETANALAADLQRYLADEPVLACPHSVGYRLRKIVRRHRGAVVAASIVAIALLAGIVGTTAGLVQAQRRAEGERLAKEEAQKRLAQVEKGTELLAEIFGRLDPIAAEGIPPRVLLGRWIGQAAQQLEGDAVGDPLVVARLQHVLGTSLRELDDLAQAEAILVKACRTRERLLGADHLDTAAAKQDLALLHKAKEKYAEAEALSKEVRAVRTAQLGADHPDTLTTQHHLATFCQSQKRPDVAQAMLEEVLALRTAKLGADHRDTLDTKHRLAGVYWTQQKYALSEKLRLEVLEARTAMLGEDHLDTVASMGDVAGMYQTQKKYALAETLFKKALAIRKDKLGGDHLDTVVTKGRLARLYLEQGEFAPAEKLFKEVAAVQTAKLGADHPRTLDSRFDLARLYHWHAKWEPAEALYKDVLRIRIAKLGPDHRDTIATKDALGALYHWQGNWAPAETLYREVIASCTGTVGADHPDTLSTQHELAKMYGCMKKYDESIDLFAKVVEGRKAKLGPDHFDTLDSQADLGDCYRHAGRFADAEPLLTRAYEDSRQRVANGSLEERYLITSLERLVCLYLAWGKPDDAAGWRKELEKTRKKP